MEALRDKQILVLGAGDTGRSVLDYAQRVGARVRIHDVAPSDAARAAIAERGVALHSGPLTDAVFGDPELIVASPGVAVAGPACDPAIARARAAGIAIVGDIELFAWEQARLAKTTERPSKVIAITGSNGKSTVTALTGAMCRAAGLRSVVAGNIGLPVLDAMHQEEQLPDVYVLELSSFQLETTHTLALDAATVLNVTQDHLDRYASFADYANAKARIFAHAQRRIVNRDDAVSMSMKCGEDACVSFGLDAPKKAKNFGVSNGTLMRGDRALISASEMPIAGAHNVANALAAFALVDAIGVDLVCATDGLRSFKGLPHRSVLVRTHQGVRYIDDSKGTNVGATVAALEGIGAPAVLIAGGEGKDQDFTPLAEAIARHAKAVVLIGKAAQAIAQALKGVGAKVPVTTAESMQAAVAAASQLAVSGDVVLLSPACASFDMFRNYKHRGEVFAHAVAALPDGTEKEHSNAL